MAVPYRKKREITKFYVFLARKFQQQFSLKQADNTRCRSDI